MRIHSRKLLSQHAEAIEETFNELVDLKSMNLLDAEQPVFTRRTQPGILTVRFPGLLEVSYYYRGILIPPTSLTGDESPGVVEKRKKITEVCEAYSLFLSRINHDLYDYSLYDKSIILACVDSGRVEWLKKFADQGEDLNKYNSRYEEQPLAYAVRIGSVEMVRRLCTYKSLRINDRVSRKFYTAAGFAARLGNLGILNLLVDSGADPSRIFYDEEGFLQYRGTALYQAARSGHIGCVRYLLGCDRMPSEYVVEVVVALLECTSIMDYRENRAYRAHRDYRANKRLLSTIKFILNVRPEIFEMVWSWIKLNGIDMSLQSTRFLLELHEQFSRKTRRVNLLRLREVCDKGRVTLVGQHIATIPRRSESAHPVEAEKKREEPLLGVDTSERARLQTKKRKFSELMAHRP